MKRTITLLVSQALQSKMAISRNELKAFAYQCKTEAQLLRMGSHYDTPAARKYRNSVALSEEEFGKLLADGIGQVVNDFIYQQTKARKKPWLEKYGDGVRLKANTAIEL